MRDITSERLDLVKTSDLFFAEAVSIFIQNRTVRQNFHWQNIIFNRCCIVKITLACKKLTQMLHYIIINFTLGGIKRGKNNWQTLLVVPCR